MALRPCEIRATPLLLRSHRRASRRRRPWLRGEGPAVVAGGSGSSGGRGKGGAASVPVLEKWGASSASLIRASTSSTPSPASALWGPSAPASSPSTSMSRPRPRIEIMAKGTYSVASGGLF